MTKTLLDLSRQSYGFCFLNTNEWGGGEMGFKHIILIVRIQLHMFLIKLKLKKYFSQDFVLLLFNNNNNKHNLGQDYRPLSL